MRIGATSHFDTYIFVAFRAVRILCRTAPLWLARKQTQYYLFQRNCIEFALSAKPVRRYIPKNPLQYRLWSFATSPFCEYTVFTAILLNTTSLAMKFYHQPTAYTDFLDVLNLFFTYFFLIECILKLGAFRFKVGYCWTC